MSITKKIRAITNHASEFESTEKDCFIFDLLHMVSEESLDAVIIGQNVDYQIPAVDSTD